MIQKKICMLGGFAVGKTSLVRRFVHSLYAEKYHTTIGVKVERKTVTLDGGRNVGLVLWDIHGDDELQKIRTSYLRGAAGYVLVVDRTRRHTLTVAQQVRELALAELGAVPFVLMLNKCDLSDDEVDEQAYNSLARHSLLAIRTSALTGQGVDDAFRCLAAAVAR